MSGPLLTTPRLELWQPQADDESQMYAIVANPATHRYLGGMADRADHFARFQRGAGSWFLKGYGPFMVRIRGEAPVIGNCGVFHSYRGLGPDFDDKPEGGWIIAAEHVGRGFAREAMDAVLGWFDAAHGPREIVCMIDPDNGPSIALAGALGFAFTRDTALPDGAPIRLFSRAGTKAAG
ncbi:GNAT family N-acetyltransferase [Tsuneonella sp. SYSU-LHT278]|uniref:GNAT family N-acetyltransferase n=1 Tax=Tsuneonella sediminis TaxID=3416089 RepID=UPI003F7A7018